MSLVGRLFPIIYFTLKTYVSRFSPSTIGSIFQRHNDILGKIIGLPFLSDKTILCRVDVVGLYPNIPHTDGLNALDNRKKNKNISSESTCILKLPGCMLDNNDFERDGETFRQKQGAPL